MTRINSNEGAINKLVKETYGVYKPLVAPGKIHLIILGLFLVIVSGCRKLVDVPPPITSISGVTAFNSDVTAIAALNGIYSHMSKSGNVISGSSGISFLTGLSSDEFILLNGLTTQPIYSYYRNQLTGIDRNNNVGSDFWKLYFYVYNCNAAVEGLLLTTSLTPAVRQQLLGEAKFLRAFAYFYLVNLFGDVPLTLSSDYSLNSTISRAPKSKIWTQIIQDLKDAQDLLSGGYVKADGYTVYNTAEERVRPNQYAAAALLARAYLYTNKFDSAELESSIVINNTSLYSLTILSNVFAKNSKEAIWQLQPTSTGRNSEDGILFLLPSTGPNSANPVYLSQQLLSSFEVGDQRRYNRNWIDSVKPANSSIYYYYPYKYRAGILAANSNGTFPLPTEYTMVLRVAEQYLIRAEARIQQGNVVGTQADLNAIRMRAGLQNTTASTQTSLLNAIYHERQTELFSEWGHRWLDLKRTNQIETVMGVATPLKTANTLQWQSYQQYYPISSSDIFYNSNLSQNMGY